MIKLVMLLAKKNGGGFCGHFQYLQHPNVHFSVSSYSYDHVLMYLIHDWLKRGGPNLLTSKFVPFFLAELYILYLYICMS